MSKQSWIDLDGSKSKHQSISADVCIIGAGAAGIYLAAELSKKDIDVVLIEAGPSKSVDSNTIGFSAIFNNNYYPGSVEGRSFGMGGTTSRWGGVLVPHTDYDLREGGIFNDAWIHIINIVKENTSDVLRALGRLQKSDFHSYPLILLGSLGKKLEKTGLKLQSALHLPFLKKNLVYLLNKKNSANKVYFNAVVKSWNVKKDSVEPSIKSLLAVSKNHNELTVNANKFIITAGAIESARILLEIDKSTNHKVFDYRTAVGSYLSDHLSIKIASFSPRDWQQIAGVFGPRFNEDWMRTFRLLEGVSPKSAPRAHVHFIFENEYPGFKIAKELLKAFQSRRMPSIQFKDFIFAGSDFAKLAYSRLIKSTLYIPSGTQVHLQLDIEQSPCRINRVFLTDSLDMYGRNILAINWSITDLDLKFIEETSIRFISKWNSLNTILPNLEYIPLKDSDEKPYDAYHPVGTCRMGYDAESTVDQNLKVRGLENAWVVSTGVLPSAGSANPTFTMLCMANHLAKQFLNNNNYSRVRDIK